MKLTAGSLAIFIALSAHPLTAGQEAKEDVIRLSVAGRAAYQKLLGAKLFSIGGIGYSGVISPYEKALRTLLKEENAVEACRWLLREARPAGRLFALYGLRLTDRETFQREADTYKRSAESAGIVRTMSGCIGGERSIREVIGDIEAARI
jgi:hypothetical protein